MHLSNKLELISWRLVAATLVLLLANSHAQSQDRANSLAIVDSSSSVVIGQPVVRKNPIERCPLVAIVDFETTKPIAALQSATTDGRSTWTQDFVDLQPRKQPGKATSDPSADGPDASTFTYSIAVMGLRPNREHRIQLRVTTEGDTAPETVGGLSIRTDPLPKSFPPLRVLQATPEEMEPGVTFFAVNFWRDSTSMLDYGFIIAVNENGESFGFEDK